MSEEIFEREYNKLNKAQKEAVDTLDGPVMVVAGPGTGKTQILALRIGNILKKTDCGSSSILCLTFTNSAVKAMRERLRKYIGPEASKVKISTFHSFGMEMLDKYYPVLGLDEKPELMDEKDAIVLCDEILQKNDWEHIRPRSDSSRYFKDLKSLISFLKRERIAPADFENEVKEEIKNIEQDPASISSRGESKGKIKKEIEKKIEGFYRALEAVKFYSLYEEAKKENNVFDYDDILEFLLSIVEESDEAENYIRENFLYVLIDEHQDSSGAQNEFLSKVWGNEEKPNIFVVGDDRQLIYGFGGASLEYFENFKHSFGKAKLITLVENYRSTQKILDSSHSLLQSSISEGKLKSNNKENHALRLVEAYYSRDEIIFCALEIKDKIKKAEGGERGRTSCDANDIAILVPKNRQVKSAIAILKDMGVPVSGGEAMNFFDAPETISFLRVLKIIANPDDGAPLAASFFDPLSGISPFQAHNFIKNNKMREFSLLNANTNDEKASEVNVWIKNLKSWLLYSAEPLYSFIQKVGTEFLLDTAKNHQELVLRIEVLRTILHLVLTEMEKPARLNNRSGENPKTNLSEFLIFLERIENYGENIPLAVFAPNDGVKVLTLHGSKGLEFDYVWIAHMDEKSFSGSRRDGFALPMSIKERVEKRDEMVLKRELYVAITRAKRFCAISYALKSYTGADQELARILSDLAEDLRDNFEKQSADETEKIILKSDARAYVENEALRNSPKPSTLLRQGFAGFSSPTSPQQAAGYLAKENKSKKEKDADLGDLIKLVGRDYEDRKVSVSLLNNFFECPWKWYFRNLLQLPEPKSESLEFGNIAHGSIDAVLKLTKKPNEKEMADIISDKVRKSGFGEDRKQKELFNLALKIVSKWVHARLGGISKSRKNEQSVSVSDDRFPHLNIYGKIDLIENLNQENVRVTDFKTGSVRKKSEIEKKDEEGRMSGYLRQLAMYSYLIKQSPKWKVDVSESRLEFVEAKNEAEIFYNTVISDEQIDLIVKDITDYDKMVKEGTWVKRPCNYNSYGKNTECGYCKMAEIYKN